MMNLSSFSVEIKNTLSRNKIVRDHTKCSKCKSCVDFKGTQCLGSDELVYSTFTTSFYSYAYYNKRLQTLFKDQLGRSKATCSFKADM